MNVDHHDGEREHPQDQVLEAAHVVAVEPDGAWLEASPAQGCANCRDGKGCGVSVFQRLFRLPRHRVYLPTNESLSVGDHVIVAMSQRALLVASVWLYLVPLAGLLGGAIVLDALFSHEALTVLGALGGLLAALAFARAQQRRQARSGGFFPVLHEVVLRQADS
ncbi:SoxR reducing system RseC family protein [Guyparkeria sp. 1SP6A2]|nr:SoxR reducing system RseC family protein [Guyparkeria sp. 1SP6A2]